MLVQVIIEIIIISVCYWFAMKIVKEPTAAEMLKMIYYVILFLIFLQLVFGFIGYVPSGGHNWLF